MVEWFELDWLQNAREIIEWANNANRSNRMILFIRHSHRLHSENLRELLHMKLTPLGHRMAKEFGRQLPDRGILEIYHSEHPRCEETAHGILEGYKTEKRQGVNRGAIRDLLGPFVHTSIGKELKELGIDQFINQWAEGEFPERQIETLEEYGSRMWKNTVLQLATSKDSTFHVHISHDLVLMSLRKAMIGEDVSRNNWIPFLGGFGIIEIDNTFQWFERGDVHKII